MCDNEMVGQDKMDFANYQWRTGHTAIYPMDKALEYLSLGLVSEAGEVAGKVKKIIRDHGSELTPELVDALELELGDVLWYIAQMCTVLKSNLGVVANRNVDKLALRKETNTLKGSGDNR
jgi:NTP pyrophosphatase (non-canonical NTP hydrolase)